MVQKKVARARGRPRAYDPNAALTGARDAFWRQGYSGTSLEVLSDATDMNRPSMYAAFGDKRALYLQTLDRYTADAKLVIERAFDRSLPLHEGLRRFYDYALATYLDNGARGCYLIGTATTEALADPEVGAKLLAALRDFERAIAERLRDAKTAGELDKAADPAILAMIASSVLHSIAVRSRAGESRAALKAMSEAAVQLICGSLRPVATSARTGKKPT
ncbi:MAG: TetR/AcrR family transcriptional regulator [Steroidobacter sp.]